MTGDENMEKNRLIYTLFAIMVGLTFCNLYENIIWLSGVLTAVFLAALILHIKYKFTGNSKSKKVFVLTLLILINFLLANAVVVAAEFVYPY